MITNVQLKYVHVRFRIMAMADISHDMVPRHFPFCHSAYCYKSVPSIDFQFSGLIVAFRIHPFSCRLPIEIPGLFFKPCVVVGGFFHCRLGTYATFDANIVSLLVIVGWGKVSAGGSRWRKEGQEKRRISITSKRFYDSCHSINEAIRMYSQGQHFMAIAIIFIFSTLLRILFMHLISGYFCVCILTAMR